MKHNAGQAYTARNYAARGSNDPLGGKYDPLAGCPDLLDTLDRPATGWSQGCTPAKARHAAGPAVRTLPVLPGSRRPSPSGRGAGWRRWILR